MLYFKFIFIINKLAILDNINLFNSFKLQLVISDMNDSINFSTIEFTIMILNSLEIFIIEDYNNNLNVDISNFVNPFDMNELTNNNI